MSLMVSMLVTSKNIIHKIGQIWSAISTYYLPGIFIGLDLAAGAKRN